MKLIALILLAVVYCAHAGEQPFPRMEESVQKFVDRYGAWVESISEDDRAWDEMLAIDEQIREVFESGRDISADPTDERWERTAEFVREHPDLMKRIRSYSKRSYLGIPKEELLDWNEEDPDYAPVPIDILLPHLSSIRTQVKLIEAKCLLAVQDRDFDSAIESLELIRSLQRFIPVSGALIEGLVEIACSATGMQVILGGEVDITELNTEQLSRLHAIYVDDPFEISVPGTVKHEHWVLREVLRYYFEDAVDEKISLKGAKRFLHHVGMIVDIDQLDGASSSEPSLGSAFLVRANIAPYSDQVQLADSYWNILQEDFQTRPHLITEYRADSFFDQYHSDDIVKSMKFGPVLLLAPDFRKVYNRTTHSDAQRNAMSLLIALHMHHLQSGKLPRNYDELDHKFLSIEPTDPMTGDRLKFKIENDQVLIYSHGIDRDDDQGVSMLNDEGEPEFYPDFLTLNEYKEVMASDPESIDGDWILYPLVTQ